jgi:hypothetical protein
MAWGWSAGLSLVHVRHAHSHLMFFGWVTPALFLLLASRAAAQRGRLVSRSVGHVLGAALVLGLVTHPLFLRFGYGSVSIGAARLPLAAIASGLAVLTWYGFVLVWIRETRGLRRTSAMLSFDLALALLVLSTLAVWPLASLRPLGLDAARWTPVLVHAFLDPFSEGWLVLAVLGLVHAEGGARRERRWALVLLAACTPFAFALGLPRGALPEWARLVSCLAAIGWAVALLAQLESVLRGAGRSWRWRLPLALGAVAAGAKLVAGLTPWIDWGALRGLRLLYLHALLFGFVSLGVLAAARGVLGREAVPGFAPIQISALALVVSLVPLTEIWPRAWSGQWVAAFAASTAAAAALALTLSLSRAGLSPWARRRPRALSSRP